MNIIKYAKHLLVLSVLVIFFGIACGGSDQQTDSSPTPAPTPAATPTTIIDSYDYKLELDGEIEITNSGLTESTASKSQGLAFFDYDGASSILLWIDDSETDIKDFLADSYGSLSESEPDVIFTPINQGDTKIDNVDSKFLAFVTESGSTQAGGIIGTWRCDNGKLFSLTSTGLDGAVIQIRFKRILDGFSCNK